MPYDPSEHRSGLGWLYLGIIFGDCGVRICSII